MRSLIAASLLLCSTWAQSQSQTQFEWHKTVICDSTKTVFEYFEKGQPQEHVVWQGQDLTDPRLTHTMLANFKTGSWTMVQHDAQYACVLAAGLNFKAIEVGEKI